MVSCSSEVLLTCDGAALHFIPVLGCCLAGRAVCVALCMRKPKNKQEVGWEEMLVVGPVS